MKIRGDILRTYQSIHTWTGIIAGLVLFIGFYAGSLSMFEDELSLWATPSTHQLPQVPTKAIDKLIDVASTKFDKAQQGFTLNFNNNYSPMTWSEEGGGRGLQLDHIVRHASLSDKGELVTQVELSNELGDLIDTLHRTAGIAGTIGHEDIGVLILGIAAILYFLALISGVIFLLPTLTKSFFALRKNKGTNRFWLDSHNLVGVISLPFHLIISLTVVVFAFHDVFYGGLSVAYGDKPLFERPTKAPTEYSIEQLPVISTYFNKVNELTDGYEIQSLEFSGLSSKQPSLAVVLFSKQEMMRSNTGDIIYMNPYTLQPTFSSIQLTEEEVYVSYIASFFSLHFGGFGGELGKWVYFIMGLLGAFLFYSGNLLWLEKRRKKQAIQSKSNRFMASLTIGICLGSMLGVVVTMLASKWLYFISININNSYLACYYITFFTALIYTFVRGAARSSIHLLYCLSIGCLLIPATSLFSMLAFDKSLWTPILLPSIMVELTAIVFAVIFFYAALKAKHRAYNGEANSVWALSTPSINEVEDDKGTISV